MEDGFLGWGDQDQCSAFTFDETPTSGAIKINAPVGIGGANMTADVRTIQQALNDVPAGSGRATPPLIVDGVCGPKTKDAIQKFQLAHFGWKGADGRVDPNGQTIAKLNQLNANSGINAWTGDDTPYGLSGTQIGAQDADPLVGEARVIRIRGLIGRARQCIKAAQANSLMGLNAVDTDETASSSFPSLSRESLMRLLNTHFAIDSFPKNDRRRAVAKVSQTFNLMEAVFSRPGGLWGAAAFDYDRLNKPYYAYTYSQGYYRSGEKLWTAKQQIRRDAIYFCRKLDDEPDEKCVVGIVHELSHFVGYPERIKDHGYGWIDDPRMKRLMPSQRILNAMSYCNYAFDARHGRRPIGV